MSKNREEIHIQTNDPFLAGRTEAAERYGHLSKNAAQWRRISLILILCCAACVFAVIYSASKITVVPYIVQVDRHGYQIAVEPVNASNVDSRMIISTVARYVWSLQTVFNDAVAQVYLMNFVYNSTPPTTPAEKKYQEHYKKNNPMDSLATGITIHTTVNSVLPLSDKTWQAEWTEVSHNNGAPISTKQYRGILETVIFPPSTMEEIINNPLGIYIVDFNFSEIIVNNQSEAVIKK